MQVVADQAAIESAKLEQQMAVVEAKERQDHELRE